MGGKEGNVNVQNAKENVKHFHDVHCLTMVLMTKPKKEKVIQFTVEKKEKEKTSV